MTEYDLYSISTSEDDEDEEIICPSCRVINYQTHGSRI
jgi:hypothetical protein